MYKILPVIAISALLLSGCASTSDSKSNGIVPADTGWSSEKVFNQAIDISLIDNWGYSGGDAKITVKNFLDSVTANREKLLSVKPSECMPIASIVEVSSNSGADYVLHQFYTDNTFLFDKLLQFDLFAYPDSLSASSKFDEFVAFANKCGSYLVNRSSESYSVTEWQKIELVEKNLLKATTSKSGVISSYAIGLVNSALFLLILVNSSQPNNSDMVMDEIISSVRNNNQSNQ
jgi:hypothetical protein